MEYCTQTKKDNGFLLNGWTTQSKKSEGARIQAVSTINLHLRKKGSMGGDGTQKAGPPGRKFKSGKQRRQSSKSRKKRKKRNE